MGRPPKKISLNHPRNQEKPTPTPTSHLPDFAGTVRLMETFRDSQQVTINRQEYCGLATLTIPSEYRIQEAIMGLKIALLELKTLEKQYGNIRLSQISWAETEVELKQ